MPQQNSSSDRFVATSFVAQTGALYVMTTGLSEFSLSSTIQCRSNASNVTDTIHGPNKTKDTCRDTTHHLLSLILDLL